MSDKSLIPYGDRDEVKELSERIIHFLPGAKSMGQAGALALAQVAVAMGLNPFNNEIWAIPQKDRDGRVVGYNIMAGIKGLRRAAKMQAQASGGLYPFYNPAFRMLTPEEVDFYAVRPGDKAIVCVLEIFLQPGHPYYMANNYRRCVVEGVGIWRKGEKTRMEPAMCSRKRAESDALKIAFDLPFGDRQANGDDLTDVEYQITAPEPEADPEPNAFEKHKDAIPPTHVTDNTTQGPVETNQAQALLEQEQKDAIAESLAQQVESLDFDNVPEIDPETGEIIEGWDEPRDESEAEAPEVSDEPFKSAEQAVLWATAIKAFPTLDHAYLAYDEIKAQKRPKNAREMARLWREEVARQGEEAQK